MAKGRAIRDSSSHESCDEMREQRWKGRQKEISKPDFKRTMPPDRILDDIGGAFGMGIAGGSVFHFIRGMYNSPAGARLSGSAEYVRMNAPRVGGVFAVWGGVFSTLDCAMVAALVGGAFLALVQGVQIATDKSFASAVQHEQALMGDAAWLPPAQVFGQSVPETSSAASEAGLGSWFGGLFGSGKKKESEGELGSKTQVLESFDTPPVPTHKLN
ncbi:hypothetical protein Bca4012_054102 [Brassica carinata]